MEHLSLAKNNSGEYRQNWQQIICPQSQTGQVVDESTVYAKTLNEVRQKLRNEQYEDEKSLNVVTKDVTLDEWYQIWMDTCKKNCRESTKTTYAGHYRRVQKALGWRKLTTLNLIIQINIIGSLRNNSITIFFYKCHCSIHEITVCTEQFTVMAMNIFSP